MDAAGEPQVSPHRAAQTVNDTVLDSPRGVLQYGLCCWSLRVPGGLTLGLQNRHFPIQSGDCRHGSHHRQHGQDGLNSVQYGILRGCGGSQLGGERSKVYARAACRRNGVGRGGTRPTRARGGGGNGGLGKGRGGPSTGGNGGVPPPRFAVRHLADHLRSRSWAHTRDLGEHNHAVPPEGAGGGGGARQSSPRFWSATGNGTIY